MTLPEHARRLFPAIEDDALLAPAGRGLLVGRLLEDGDERDLRWLAARLGEDELRVWFGRHGGRRLSRRSRAFWRHVLGVVPAPGHPLSEALWPL